MYLDAVWFLYLCLCPVGDKVRAHHLVRAGVDDRVGHYVLVVDVVPRCGAGVERVAGYIHSRHGNADRVCYLVGSRIDAIEFGRCAVVVASRTDPQLSLRIGAYPPEVLCHGDTFGLHEGLQVNYRHRAVVVRHHVSAGVSYVQFAVSHSQLVRLVAYQTGAVNLQGGCVEPCHVTYLRMTRVQRHRTGVRGDVCILAVEGYVPAVGYIHLPDTFARSRVEYLHLVRAVDHGVQTIAVNLQIIAHIAQLLRHVGVRLGVDVPAVGGGGVVVVVERRFVAAHIPLVEQVEAYDYRLPYACRVGRWNNDEGIAYVLLFHRYDRLVVAAGGK